MARGDLSRWSDAFADVVGAIGTPAFDQLLLKAVNAVVVVDHLTVLTYRTGENLQTLSIASRADLAQARSLTRDYVAHHHVFDPNFVDVVKLSRSRSRRIVIRRHDRARLKTKAYQRRFYSTVGIVDKVSYLWRLGDVAFYVNLYRTVRTGHYVEGDIRCLTQLARMVGSLVRMHGGRKRLEVALTTGNFRELVAKLVELLGPHLTAREQSVLACILTGMHTEGIALSLRIKPTTVITFRKRAYAKLGIATQTELLARCLRVLPQLPIGAQL
ncbi:helix-turn-helix transcriptional regulator [Bradyrhizobium sp. CCGB12]|uniref:helix-turn-helix transcriptional regulator n=1 Tax=Bradyrhizobium sp. CCGB12 TaxID=2949632 RepID=UPI0020B40FF7|nr:helix-turn-helix transcriptional regulator [Bradyrhizobium sp. CCGB12]MCP3387830.1 helix-turn-helix transcriptional regulator [Bradyrhizobium sp. CCGB12]